MPPALRSLLFTLAAFLAAFAATPALTLDMAMSPSGGSGAGGQNNLQAEAMTIEANSDEELDGSAAPASLGDIGTIPAIIT